MRVLITGAGSGIGRATAQLLSKRGHEVAATARSPETLEDLDVSWRLPLDVNDDASVGAVLDTLGFADVVVNNAAVNMPGPIERFPLDKGREMFEANVFGPARVIQAFLPGMRDRERGVVVNISSVVGHMVQPLGGFHAATKHALEAISEALHYEAGHFGIRVRIIEPGFVAPGLKDRGSFGEGPPYDELRRQYSGVDTKVLHGGGRPGPEAVAAVIAEAIETNSVKLRWPVGSDAKMVLTARAQLNDEEFEAALREFLGLTW